MWAHGPFSKLVLTVPSGLASASTARRQRNEQFGTLPLPLVLLTIFAGVLLAHRTLLHLPYFWDEGGYYVPAALDFYRSGTLIPAFTNAHPPLPSVVLGAFWHLYGFRIVVTRVTACLFAAGALTAVFALGRRLLGQATGFGLALLTAIYPIWFAQTSLAHADIFAAAFTLSALAIVLPSLGRPDDLDRDLSALGNKSLCSALFCCSVLAKETAIVQPVILAVLTLFWAYQHRAHRRSSVALKRWACALLVPLPVLAAWYAYHFAKTGQIFGNPVYLHYNATNNFTLAHIAYAVRIRFVHLFWQREMWVPLTLAAACFLLPLPVATAANHPRWGLPRRALAAIAALVFANLLAFSVLGGALLTRYLLPIYPLLLLVCIAIWRAHLKRWPWMVLVTAAVFIPALWLNPSTFFAPEDNLTYRNMILVQQQAIQFLAQRYPDARVLTAWPVSAELFRPELGYTDRRFRVSSLENFTMPELMKAAAQPGEYDTALIFTTHYTSPSFRRFLLGHPLSWQGRRYAADLDLSPVEVAHLLGGRVVWQSDLYGEWAAVLRFERTYDASLAFADQVDSAKSGVR